MMFLSKLYGILCKIDLRLKGIRCGKDSNIKGFVSAFVAKKSHILIGDNFSIRSGARRGIGNESASKIIVSENAFLSIGNNVGMTNVCLLCQEKIYIGNHVLLGAGVMIMDSNFHDINWKGRLGKSHGTKNAKTAPVCIGDHVFIGARSIICKGVTIGSKSVIAAGSVVIKDIPENQIWGGNPAQYIKSL